MEGAAWQQAITADAGHTTGNAGKFIHFDIQVSADNLNFRIS